MTIKEYFGILDKDRLKRLRIEFCDKCGHMTMQMESYGHEWVCLTCGTVWELAYVEAKK